MTGAGAAWGAIAALVLVTALVLLAIFATRVRRIAYRVGSFECAVRPSGQEKWTSGIASYGAGRVDWHRLVSLRLRASRSWRRERLDVLGRELRSNPGGDGHVFEVRCRYAGQEFELAMLSEAYAGFVSWLEAAPPRGEPRL